MGCYTYLSTFAFSFVGSFGEGVEFSIHSAHSFWRQVFPGISGGEVIMFYGDSDDLV